MQQESFRLSSKDTLKKSINYIQNEVLKSLKPFKLIFIYLAIIFVFSFIGLVFHHLKEGDYFSLTGFTSLLLTSSIKSFANITLIIGGFLSMAAYIFGKKYGDLTCINSQDIPPVSYRKINSLQGKIIGSTLCIVMLIITGLLVFFLYQFSSIING
jgi:hypothetical protein